MAQHAKLSPSAAGTWMTCPGALPLRTKLIDEGLVNPGKSSIYADLGTAMHEVAEKCLNDDMDPKEFIGHEVYGHEITEDMAKISAVFVDFVRELEGWKSYEQRVRVHSVDGVWGTADCISFHKGHLRVNDLKTGRGVKVDAHENKQLLCYALAAYHEYSMVWDIEKVTVTIIQPPLNHIDSYEISITRLEAFEEELIAAVQRMKDEPETYVPSTKACKFCAAKPWCPAQHDMANEAAVADFESITRTELVEWAKKAPIIKDFLKSIEDRVKADLDDGKQVPGFKLVEGRRDRVWTDEKEFQAKLLKAFPGEDFYFTKRKLLSPSQMEKAMKGRPFDYSEFVTRKEGKPTVATEDDPRDAYSPASAAAEDFSEVE